MKTKVFLRIGKDGIGIHEKIRVEAGTTFKADPIRVGTKGYNQHSIPTVFMALEIEIPDVAFKPPNICASISVPIEKTGTAVEVVDPMRMI